MADAPYIAEVAALVGDPARANILMALMDGRALTATELAYVAGVTPQTASGHLSRLTEGRLLVVERQGRHRYFRVASPEVARLVEALSLVAVAGPPRHRPASRIDAALREARTCYDHLAGRLGVALADALIASGHVILDRDGGELTAEGAEFLGGFGVDLDAARRRRRMFCRPCLDWSERRPHLAGAVGAALASRCFELGWFERIRDSRALRLTATGRAGLENVLAVSLAEGDARATAATR